MRHRSTSSGRFNARKHRSGMRRLGTGIVVLFSLLCMWHTAAAAFPLTDSQALKLSWARATRIGQYSYRTQAVQTIHPVAKLSNAGRGSKTTHLSLSGEVDRHAETLHMTIQGYSGTQRPLEVLVEDGRAHGRTHPQGAWQELDSATTDVFAPGGDLLGYLVAVTNINEFEPGADGDAGVRDAQTSYRFEIDSSAYARYMGKQLETQLRTQGKLPPSLSVDLADMYKDMVGTGQIWLDSDGLPIRQDLHLTFPAQDGSNSWVEATMTTNFVDWRSSPTVTVTNIVDDPRQLALALGLTNQELGNLAIGLFVLVLLTGLSFTAVRYHRSRRVYSVFVLLLVLSMLVTPQIQAAEVDRFFNQIEQEQTTAAAPRTTEALGDVFNPQADPLKQAPINQQLQSSGQLVNTTTNYTTGEDSDGDGLNNEVEILTLDTEPDLVDSDGDSINDRIEILGFNVGGNTWYLDPLGYDSNGDGLDDGVECPQLVDATSTAIACQDTDNDDMPDVYDFDNDGDGVPDTVDSAPTAYSTLTTTTRETLNFQASGYTAGKALNVSFELRPSNPDHLWYNNNVLDWPTNDTEGQITRVFDTTFLDEGSDGTKMDYGDMLLTPMVEITIPYSETNPAGGLPVVDGYAGSVSFTNISDWLDQDILASYGVSVNQNSSGDELLVYVPVSAVNDTTGDTPVAFSAQMYYRPTNSNWGGNHQVKLLWLVNALVDTCITTDMPDSVTYDEWCAELTHWETDTTIMQTYYDQFTVTGLTVEEQYGMDVALIGQPEAANGNLAYEDSLWHLAANLQEPLLEAQSVAATNQRFGISEIARRFDRDSNSSVSDSERWGIAATKLDVATYSYTNETLGYISLADTDIESFLNTELAPNVGAGVTMTVLMASESSYLVTTLDNSSAVQVSGDLVSVNMTSLYEQTTANLNWWTYVSEGDASWAIADVSDVLDGLAVNLMTVFTDAELNELLANVGDTVTDYDLSQAGAISFAQSFYMTIYQGTNGIVELDRSSTGSATLDDSLYLLASGDEAVTEIVYAIFGGLHAFFINEASISIDGAEIANSVTLDLGDGSDLLENVGLSWVEYNEQLIELSKYSSKAVSSGVTKLLKKYIKKALEADGIMNSKTGKRIGKVSTLANVFCATMTTLRILGVVDETQALNISMESIKNIGALAGLYKDFESFARFKGLTPTLKSNIKVSTQLKMNRYAKASAVIGLVLEVAIVSVLFIVSVVSAGISPNDLAFTALLAEALAQIIVAIIMAIISATVIGALFVALIELIDAMIAVVCASQGKSSDQGFCSGITGALTKFIADLLFDQTTLVNFNADDRIQTTLNDISITEKTSAQGSKVSGFVVGNTLNYSMIITTNLSMSQPDEYGSLFPEHFTNEELNDTKVGYGLQTSTSTIAANDPGWIQVNETSNPRYYQVFNPTTSVEMTTAGINNGLEVFLSEHIIVDAQECWLIVLIPVCYLRNSAFNEQFNTSLKENFTYDILPGTLDGFYSLEGDGIGGFHLAWDTRFPSLMDADGDGLVSRAKGGADPDDSTWDYDGDGLSDYWEYQNGYAVDASDGDNDGLSDYWEVFYGTNPTMADSDSDGLEDGAEFFHPDALNPYSNSTTTWSGGWTITYGADNSGTMLVNADPNLIDTDSDGILDKREYIYGYNPNLYSKLNVLSLETEINTSSGARTLDDEADVVAPGDTFEYVATVTNELTNRYANGIFEAEFPSDTLRSQETLTTLAPNESVVTSDTFTIDPGAFTQTTVTSLTLRAGALIQDLADGRVVQLLLNETAGTTFTDSSLQGHDATCSGTSCPALNGSTANFDGSNDYLTIADDSDLDLSIYSMSIWVKPDSIETGDTIFSTEYAYGARISIYDGRFLGWFGVNGCKNIHSLGITGNYATVDVGSWNHLVITNSGTSVALYHNGVLIESKATNSSCSSHNQIMLGTDARLSSGKYFDGQMDDFEVFNYALSSDQVADLYTKPSFELSSGTSYTGMRDDSDYASTLTCSLTSSNLINCPPTTTGVVGNGYSFNQDQYFAVTAGSSVDAAQADNKFTMALWVNPGNGYTPDTQHFSTYGQLILGNDQDGYSKAPPSLYIKDQNLVVRFGLANGNYCEASTDNNALAYNTWQHIIVTYDGSIINLYKNGALSDTFSTTGGATCSGVDLYSPSGASSSGNWTFYVGGGNTPAVRFSTISDVDIGDTINYDEKYQEGYLWDNTSGQLLWDSGGGTIKEGHTTTINTWLRHIGADSLNFTFCGRDDSPQGSTCPGEDFYMCWDGSYTQSGGKYRYTCSTQGQTATIYSTSRAATSKSVQYNSEKYYPTTNLSHIVFKLKGKLNYTIYNDGFLGSLDEIKLYRKALDANAIEDLYTGSLRTLELGFDEPSGQSSFADSSGNGYDASCTVSTGTCPDSGLSGRSNQALQFDGVDDYISVGNESNFDFTNKMTVAAWIKVDSFTKTWQSFVTKGDSAWRLHRYGTSNYVAFDTTGLSKVSLAGDINVNDGKWHHVVGVYDGSSKYLYVDGVLDASTSATGNISTNNHAVHVGGNAEQSTRMFHGKIDSVMISQNAFSQSQVQALMNEAPVLNLHLDQGYGTTTFIDDTQSSNKANCFDAACPLAGADSLMRESPLFQGSDKLLINNATDSLDLDTNFSIAMWVKPTTTKGAVQTLLQKYNGSSAASNYHLWIKPNSTYFKFDLHPASTCTGNGVRHVDSQDAGVGMNEDQWNHLVATYDSNTLRLYLNGQFVGLQNHGSTGTVAACTTGTTINIGDNFEGQLDEVTISDTLLDDDDILALYNYQEAWFDTSYTHLIAVDMDSPVSALSVADGAVIDVDLNRTLTISATDDTSNVVAVQYQINGGAWQTPTREDGTVANDHPAWSFIFTPSGAGEHTVVISASDAVGNTSQSTTSFTVDQTAPGTTLEPSLSAAIHQSNDTLNLYGSVIDALADVERVNVELVDWQGSSVSGLESASIEASDAPEILFHFDENDPDTTSFVDSSPTKATATCSGRKCPLVNQDGYRGKALDFSNFDGDEITTNTPGPEMGQGSFTLAAWVKTGSGGVTQAIISKNDRDFDWETGERVFFIGSGGSPIFYGGSDGYIYGNQSVFGTTWRHVAVTWNNQTKVARMYIDGVDATNNTYTTYNPTNPDIANAVLTIGSDPSIRGGITIIDFNDTMDEVIAFDRALTAEELVELITDDGSQLNLRLDNQVAVTGGYGFVDSSVNNQTVDCATTTCPGLISHGYTGNALSFNGSQYLEADMGSTFTNGQFTQMAWVYPTSTDTGFHGIMGYQPAGGATQRSPSLWINNSTKLHGGFGTGTQWIAFNTDHVLSVNTWNHVAATFDGSAYKIYVNAKLVHTSTAFAGKTPYANTSFTVGKVDTTFQGRLDDVQIFNTAFSVDQIADIVGADGWSIDYPLAETLYGSYDVHVTATDEAGNSATTNVGTVQIDGLGPIGGITTNSSLITATDTLLSGVVSDVPYPWENKLFHFHAEEVTGSTSFADSSKNHLRGTCSSTTCPAAGQSGKHGSALFFDGRDDTLQVIDSTLDMARADFTLAAWVKTTGVNQALLTKSDGDTSWERGEKSFYLDGSGMPTFVGWGNNYIRSTQAINDGAWHHVAVTWNYESGTSGSGTIYVDGLDVTNTTTTNYAANNIDRTTDTLGIGRPNGQNGEAPNYFNGSLDEVVAYNRALSAAELHEIANPLDTPLRSAALRFRHITEVDQSEDAGLWYPVTLASTDTNHTTWNYTLDLALEGLYKLDLKLVDTLGNETFIPAALTTEIDTRAPRVTFAYTPSGSNATVRCSATDFNLSTNGWSCPVADTFRSAGYQSADWYTVLTTTQKLETLTTTSELVANTGTSMTACDLYGNCTTRTYNSTTPGGLATPQLWLQPYVNISTNTNGAPVNNWYNPTGDIVAYQNTAGIQPTYQSNMFNGKPTVRFDGTNDYFFTNSRLNPQSSSHTVRFVATPYSSNAGNLASQQDGSGTGRSLLYYSASKLASSLGGSEHLSTTELELDVPAIVGYSYNTDQTLSFERNGVTEGTHTLTPESATGIWIFGADKTLGTGFLDGDFAEVVVESDDLDITERAQLDSYLALKYGLTLDAAQPYRDSSGTVIWDATAMNGYHNDVAALARDDASGLLQLSSRSSSNDSIITMTGTASDDRSFLIWGNDDSAANTTSTQTVGTATYTRLNRTWRVQKIGSVDVSTFSFELSDLGLTLSRPVLLIDADGDFSDATVYIGGRSVNGSTVSFTNVPLEAGDYFTLVTDAQAPGGVSSGLRLWLAGDMGITTSTDGAAVNTWYDSSGNGYDLTQATATHQPKLSTSGINGVPSLTFDTSDYLSTSLPGSSLFDTQATTVFFVKHSTSSSGVWFNWQTSSTNRVGFELANSNPRFDVVSKRVVGFTPVNDAPHLIMGLRVALAQDLYIDGQLSNQAVNTGSLANSTTMPLVLGKYQTGTLNWTGEIAEVIVYNRALNTTEVQAVEQYLAAKYGLTVAARTESSLQSSTSVTPTTTAARESAFSPLQSIQEVVLTAAAPVAPVQTHSVQSEVAPTQLATDWMNTSCALLGVDTRLAAQRTAAHNLTNPQRFYADWDTTTLRFAWEGADWRNDGDLFIYLDSKPGGTNQVYNPYPTTISTTAILLPLFTPPSTPPNPPPPSQPVGADYLVLLQEDSGLPAFLLSWDSTTEQWLPAQELTYAFDPNRAAPLTVIEVPFTALGIVDPATQPLKLIALASAEDALTLWSTMPTANTLNEQEVTGELVQDDLQVFALSRPYAWSAMNPDACVSGVDAAGTRLRQHPGDKIAFNGADLSATLSADPAGVAYAFFRHHLLFAHQTLLGEQHDFSGAVGHLCPPPPPGMPPSPACQRAPDDGRPNANQLNIRSQLARLFGVDHVTVKNGQTINYTLEIRNTGERRAERVVAEITTPAALRLPQGQLTQMPDGSSVYRQLIMVGTLQPGEIRTLTFPGIVDSSINPQRVKDWIHLRTVVFDETGDPRAPTEDLHLDHELDTTAPAYAEILEPRSLIGNGIQTFNGVVRDQSAVPTITLDVAGQQTICPDPTPEDGQWSCAVDLRAYAADTQVPIRIKARDIHGQESPWIDTGTFTVDAVAPVVALSSATSSTLQMQTLGGRDLSISGAITDDHSLEAVEICTQSADGTVRCQDASLSFDQAQTLYTYDDQPATPLSFGLDNGCQTGTPLIRTFAVSDTFTIADVELGLMIEHSFRNDVVVWLRSPQGTEVELVSRGANAANLNVWLDDAAMVSSVLDADLSEHSLNGAPYTNLRQPFTGLLAAFNGETAQGTWQLRICDHYPPEDAGSYLSSRIQFRSTTGPGLTVGTWSGTLDAELNTTQAYTVEIYGFDRSGNRSNLLSFNPTIDTTAPMLDVVTFGSAEWIPQLVITGTVQDETSTFVRMLVRTPTLRLSWHAITSEADQWSLQQPPVLETGVHCVWIESADRAGNSSRQGPFAIEVAPYVEEVAPYTVYLPVLFRHHGAGGPYQATNPHIDRYRVVDPDTCR